MSHLKPCLPSYELKQRRAQMNKAFSERQLCFQSSEMVHDDANNRIEAWLKVLLLLLFGCLTSQQHASVSQGRICSGNCTCCHTEVEAVEQTFYLTQSQYTDTGPTSPNTDPITPGAWQGSHWSANCLVTRMTRPGKIPLQARFEHRIFRSRGGRLNH